MIMDKEKLKKDYENACNAYLEAFCEKHEFYGLKVHIKSV